MKLTKREKILLLAAVIIIGTAVFIMYYYVPQTKKNDELKFQSEDLSMQLQTAKAIDAQNKELEKKLAEKKKTENKENENMLKLWDQAELLVLVEDTLGSYCEKDSIDFYDPQPVGSIQAGDIGLKIKTDYEGLQKIWEGFEGLQYLTTVTSFEISASGGSDSGTTATNPGQANSVNTETKTGQKDLEVNMNIRLYAQDQSVEYPKDYDFMTGKYGKANPFK